jgi:protein ImuA
MKTTSYPIKTSGPGTLARLRAELSALVRAAIGAEPPPLSFGLADIDEVLGGGLARGALHEVTPAAEGDAPAAAGFCAAILSRALSSSNKSALWVRHDFATVEDGVPYGPGLAAFGLDPGRVMFVLAPDARAVLDAMETALRSGTVVAVLGELRGATRLDLRATRRLALAAGRGATAGLLLRLGETDKLLSVPVAATTRWRVRALASGEAPADGIGAPRFEAALIRNRRGPAASFSLEWRSHDRVFFPALRERLAPAAVDGSHPAPASGERRASA